MARLSLARRGVRRGHSVRRRARQRIPLPGPSGAVPELPEGASIELPFRRDRRRFRSRLLRSRRTTTKLSPTASSTRTARVMSTNPTIALFALPTTFRSPSSTSSGHGQAGTSRFSLASCEKTIPRRGRFWSRRAPSVGRWTSPNPFRSKIRLNGGMRCARLACACTRRGSGAVSSRRTAASARSARWRKTAYVNAAHILGTNLEAGHATVQNGLSLCAIHHRAFDQNLVGVSPERARFTSRVGLARGRGWADARSPQRLPRGGLPHSGPGRGSSGSRAA